MKRVFTFALLSFAACTFASAETPDELFKKGASFDVRRGVFSGEKDAGGIESDDLAAKDPDFKKAFGLYKQAAERGHAQAMLRVCDAYQARSEKDVWGRPPNENKYGIKPDISEAYAWAAVANDYTEGKKQTSRAKAAKSYLAREIKQKDAEAKKNTGSLDTPPAKLALRRYQAIKALVDAKVKADGKTPPASQD